MLTLECWLLKIPWVFKAFKYVWAIWMTGLTMIRYFKGVRERRKMGMTFEQAADRAHHWEMQRIDEMLSNTKSAAFLAQRRIDKIKKEIGS